jgi:hypothetical protein
MNCFVIGMISDWYCRVRLGLLGYLLGFALYCRDSLIVTVSLPSSLDTRCALVTCFREQSCVTYIQRLKLKQSRGPLEKMC